MVLGKHILLELYDCPEGKLDDIPFLEKTLVDTAEVMNATVVNTNFHHFNPYGVSGVVVIQESHLTIHTWPEYNYAAVDIFTCGDLDLEAGTAYLVKTIEAQSYLDKMLSRGIGHEFQPRRVA